MNSYRKKKVKNSLSVCNPAASACRTSPGHMFPRADTPLPETQKQTISATVRVMMNDKVEVTPRRSPALPLLRARFSCSASGTAPAPSPSNLCLKRSKKPHCFLSLIFAVIRERRKILLLARDPSLMFRLESPSCKCLALSRSFVSFDLVFFLVIMSVFYPCVFRLPQQKIAIGPLVRKKRMRTKPPPNRWIDLIDITDD